ncbi:MAG: hypothetical protein ABIQ12_08240 [Opitutaceae bacterium]
MNSALTLLCIVAVLGFAIGCVMTVVCLLRAPEGVEDELGFRYLHSADTKGSSDDHVHHSGAELA